MIEKWVGTEHWWNDNDRVKLKHSGERKKDIYQCICNHHQSQLNWPVTESVCVYIHLNNKINKNTSGPHHLLPKMKCQWNSDSTRNQAKLIQFSNIKNYA
jgi:hypothetical protein